MAINFIKKASKNYEEIYDDTERQIGTWFGEAIYRKTLKLTVAEYNAFTADNNKKLLPLGFNVDLLLKANMTVKYTDTNNNTKTFFMHSLGSGNYEVGVNNCVNNVLQIYIGPNVLPNLTDYIYITLEYTKRNIP